MSGIKAVPMGPFEAAVITVLSLSLAAQLVLHDWADALDGAVIILLFLSWSQARRKYEGLIKAIRAAGRATA